MHFRKKIDEKRHILSQTVQAVVYLGKRGIAFDGNIEDTTSPQTWEIL